MLKTLKTGYTLKKVLFLFFRYKNIWIFACVFMSNKLLWNQIQKGDHKAFKKVFDLYYQMLYSYIIQFTRDKEEAEDIVQSAFIKLWERRTTLRITESIKSYLFRTAYHTFIDAVKKQNRSISMLEEIKYKALMSQIEEDNDIGQERVRKIKKLINDLPLKCREVLLLSKESGLKNKEIADQLNISIKTVESQIRIAFQKIRRSF